MSKSLRLSEKWFRRGLWLVSLVFASFLIGLGGTVVDDLPKVEATLQLDDFLDRPAAETLRAQVRNAQQAEESAETALDQARLQRAKSRSETAAERETFNNWLATRSATQQSEHNPEVVQRTQALDRLQLRERQTQQAVEAQQQAALDARQAATAAQQRLAALEKDGYERMAVQQRKVQLRVFLYRLALTLPLLVVAGWLFVKKRKGTYWPFVWGFIFFALFAFFVELVPYLPSYGGYVRYVVGIVVTALVGRYAIVALNRYLERQKRAEALPDQERRKELSYDVALARLAKGVCPGCERPVDLKDPTIDFCPHCGIGLFDHCGACNTRKSAFARFCHACGAGAGRGLLPGSDSDASAAVVPHAAGPLAGGPAPAGPL
ncbi:zinc ribbon domain-containing protein [Acidovorax sp. SUPP3434]|uniref:zinc ribbon domain-containing protein n=1 Tax=Acidovorax sp. SUPP3434 TaxID=2920880 RepID=UPI0023DE449C|nr:zinc ribbon domain-containing protein [Acidovorax sp. SUPP3434]GKT01648.1 zinc ribbon domain-containing protein [Acidovorax sp. SUPP3434]